MNKRFSSLILIVCVVSFLLLFFVSSPANSPIPLGAATSTIVSNLFIKGLSSSGSPCLIIASNGSVSTSTCAIGPSSSDDNAIARFDGTTGTIQNSSILVGDLIGGVVDITFPTVASGTTGIGVTITSGDSGGGNQAGGAISIISGNGTGSGNGGAYSMTGGNGGADGSGGRLDFNGGSAGGGNNNGGDIIFAPGSNSGTGAEGRLVFTDPETSFNAYFSIAALSSDQTFTYPNASGTFAITTSTWTNGSIPFTAGGLLQQNNGRLFWDNANVRLGVGTSTPTYSFHVWNVASTTVAIGATSSIACLVMGDSDGGGLTYISANNGVLSATTTKPAYCE